MEGFFWLGIGMLGIASFVWGITGLFRDKSRQEDLQKVKKILRELILSATQNSYAEKTCSLNRARNLLSEISDLEYVDASELLRRASE